MPKTPKDIWELTVALLDQNGFTTRGEKKKDAQKKKKQFFFEKRLLTNPVGNGKHR